MVFVDKYFGGNYINEKMKDMRKFGLKWFLRVGENAGI